MPMYICTSYTAAYMPSTVNSILPPPRLDISVAVYKNKRAAARVVMQAGQNPESEIEIQGGERDRQRSLAGLIFSARCTYESGQLFTRYAARAKPTRSDGSVPGTPARTVNQTRPWSLVLFRCESSPSRLPRGPTTQFPQHPDLIPIYLPPRAGARRQPLQTPRSRPPRSRSLCLSNYFVHRGETLSRFQPRPRAKFRERARIKYAYCRIFTSIFREDSKFFLLKRV